MSMQEAAKKPNVGDKLRFHGGLITYEVLGTPVAQIIGRGPGGSSPIVTVVSVRRTELYKPDADGKGGGTFAERVWEDELHLLVWGDLISRAATVERAYVAPANTSPKLSG